MECCIYSDGKSERLHLISQSLGKSFFLEGILKDLSYLKENGKHIIPTEKIRNSYQDVLDMLTEKRAEDTMLPAFLTSLRDGFNLPSPSIDYVQIKLIEFDKRYYLGEASYLLRNP